MLPNINARDVCSHLSEARTTHQTDMACSNYCDIHPVQILLSLPLLNFLSYERPAGSLLLMFGALRLCGKTLRPFAAPPAHNVVAAINRP